MPSQTLIRFSQSCPTCGRRVQIRSGLLGKTVSCQHCNAQFVAKSMDQISEVHEEVDHLMQRVESALLRSQSVATS